MDLCNNLIRFRKNLKLSQEEMAKKIDVARATYGAYERGTREPDIDTLTKLAEVFEISIDELVGHENTSNNEITFENFIADSDLREWYKNLGAAPEDDLNDLKIFYDTFIAKKHNK
ncbi:helix-turn-helix transcriptional regulator [Lysinibacillus sp. NPDC047702]|uniref:helix-turn-helix transcriptional regulator n=1 Tax=unclassified Lysinibacillus TaxID=2636778 RepID=UPI003D0296C0